LPNDSVLPTTSILAESSGETFPAEWHFVTKLNPQVSSFPVLSPEQRIQLKDVIDQFQQKCLMSFGKYRSGVPYLKSDMPRVLLQGEPDTTTAEEKQETMNAF
jgi:hypothetical protein